MPAHPLTPSEVADYLAKEKQSQIKDPSGKPIIQQTSRPIGTKTYFTSEGDDTSSHPTTMTKVGGGGDFLEIDHTGTEGTGPESIYSDFNIAENRTFLHEGYIQWEGAVGDTVTLEIVTKPTTTNADTGTEFKLYGGYLIVGSSFPAGSVINVNDKTTVASLVDADVKLVYIPVSRDTGLRPSAYWNADYNTTTHVYENIAYAPLGDGKYNMFSTEVVLERFVNNMKLRKDGFMVMKTSDTSEIGQNMRVKFTGNTIGTDHAWYCSATIVMHRIKTV